MATSTIKYNAGDTAPLNAKANSSYEDLCFECGRKLGANPFYMHVNTSWELITRFPINEDSQGCFPIGATCANKFADGILFQYEKEAK